jgi:hypothetical protein
VTGGKSGPGVHMSGKRPASWQHHGHLRRVQRQQQWPRGADVYMPPVLAGVVRQRPLKERRLQRLERRKGGRARRSSRLLLCSGLGWQQDLGQDRLVSPAPQRTTQWCRTVLICSGGGRSASCATWVRRSGTASSRQRQGAGVRACLRVQAPAATSSPVRAEAVSRRWRSCTRQHAKALLGTSQRPRPSPPQIWSLLPLQHQLAACSAAAPAGSCRTTFHPVPTHPAGAVRTPQLADPPGCTHPQGPTAHTTRCPHPLPHHVRRARQRPRTSPRPP